MTQDDIFGKLGSGFTQLGKRVRSGASELKKAAGIGVGSLHVSLERFDFRPGETVTGEITLRLSEPMEAKRLVVRLMGTRERVSYSKDAQGGRSQTKHTETLCEIERELDGERSYLDQRYQFSVAIPTDIDAGGEISDQGVFGDVARVVRSVASARRLPTAWRVDVFLDVPWKRNIKRSIDITVRE